MLICSRCKSEKEESEFYKNKSNKSGYNTQCKDCVKEYYKNSKERLKERRKEQQRKYKEKNKTKIKEYNRNYRKANRDKITAERRHKRHTDPFYNFICNVRVNINSSFRRRKFGKGGKTQEILGCTFDEFKLYIENQFVDGMSWESFEDIHLDHIVPLATANTIEDVIKLCHYTNYQPLWKQDNLKKGCKIID